MDPQVEDGSAPEPQPVAPEPAAEAEAETPPLLRLRLAGPEAMALVGVCRARVLKHQEENGDGAEGKDELVEAARELALYEEGQEEVSVAQLRAVRAVLRRLATPSKEGQPVDAEKVFAETLLKGSRLAFPRHAQRKAAAQARLKSKEAWRQGLVARSQQREYDRMVKNVHWGGQRKPDAETRPFYQASIAFNMIAAMATAGFLGYYAAGSIMSEENHRIMVGTVTAMGMLMVEMVLYIIRTCELERYQPKQRRNEEMGRKGLTIPTGDPLDDVQFWRMHNQGGRARQRLMDTLLVPSPPPAGDATTALVDKAESSDWEKAEGEEQTQPLLPKDKDV